MSGKLTQVNIRFVGHDDASVAVNRVRNATRGLSRTMATNQSFMVRNRRTVQQAGFQISDFAIQVAGGQSAMLAFTQQGPQFLQFFGAFGAVLAGLVAVFGSLAVVALKSGADLSKLGALTGVLQEGFGSLGVAITKVGGYLIDFGNLIINNFDRIIITASILGAYMAGPFVVSFVAAKVALIGARIAALGFVGALITLRNIMLRFLPLAVLIALGEMIHLVLRLKKHLGGAGEVLALFKDIAMEVFPRVVEAFKAVPLGVKLGALKMAKFFVDQLYQMQWDFALFTQDIAEGLNELFGTSLSGMNTPQLRYSALGQAVTALGEDVAFTEAEFRGLTSSITAPVASLERLREAMAATKGEQFDLRSLMGLGGSDDDSSDGVQSAVDQVKTLADHLRTTLKSGIDSVFDAIVDKSKSVKSALRDVIRELAKVALKTQMYQSLGSLFPSIFGSSGSIPLTNAGGGLLNAKGNAFANGSLQPFAKGGIVNGPTVFPMRSGTGLMGEAGPEAIMPLTRGKGGKLGVAASGGGGDVTVNQTINIHAMGDGDIDRVLAKRMPQMKQMTLQAVRNERARGAM